LEPPQPACSGRCITALDRLLDKVAQLIEAGVHATSGKQCSRKLRKAAKTSKELRKRVVRLADRNRYTPPDRGQRLLAEANYLADGAGILATGDFCSRP
jgi:hypothetical protein